MKSGTLARSWRLPALALAAMTLAASGQEMGGSATSASGLIVRFKPVDTNGDGEVQDVMILPEAALHVPAGQSPTPFLPAGRFVSEWTGAISVEIRDNYTFSAELNGTLKVAINGSVALEATGENSRSEPGKTVRLNKGANSLAIRFESPSAGDAFFRLEWASREFPMEPVSPAALSHLKTPDLETTARLHRGRELFLEFRCAKCHQPTAGNPAVPELAMDAPSLDGLGERRNQEWMVQWILDPASMRPTARMPKMLHGDGAEDDARAIAAFLASPQASRPPSPAATLPSGDAAAGRKLFESLHCAACHLTPGAGESDTNRIALAHVREKFPPGRLVEFLRKPEAHYAWIRMPNFHLNESEAAHLAAFLEESALPLKSGSSVAGSAERGRELVQTLGCLNCHPGGIENKFQAPALADLPEKDWTRGCMAEEPPASARAPVFPLSSGDRAALRLFASTDRKSLARHVPLEFALRQSRSLNCRDCHGRFEGFPAFEILGGKLRPEWAEQFIGGRIKDKPRFWLEARMPGFGPYAEPLAHGLAMLHGYPARTPDEPPIDLEAAKIGQRLVAIPPDGFACVQCHGVARVGATQVFESNGINLALAADRLLKPFYHRWLLNPLRIDPTSKMPVYFDEEGRSPLTEVYEGDGRRQIEAFWQYMRLGKDMPPPPGTQPAP